MGGAVPPFPQYAFMARCSGGAQHKQLNLVDPVSCFSHSRAVQFFIKCQVFLGCFRVRLLRQLTTSVCRCFLVSFRASGKGTYSPDRLSGCVAIPVADLNVSV
jgi:hypothetical protein